MHVYSLKDTAVPEYTFVMDSGVTSLDFHPRHHMLLAVGCYDGSVRIFDVRARSGEPIFRADFHTGKHSDPVWGVHWADPGVSGAPAAAVAGEAAGGGAAGVQAGAGSASAAAGSASAAAGGAPAATAAGSAAGGGAAGAGKSVAPADASGGGAPAASSMGELALYSVSADGTVAHWLITKSELTMETVSERAPYRRRLARRLPVASPPRCPLTHSAAAAAARARTQVMKLKLIVPPASASADASAALTSGGSGGGDGGTVSLAAAVAAAGSDGHGGGGGGGGGGEGEARAAEGLVAGTCLAFNPFFDSIFLVGTEEGHIHKCSLDFAGEYLATFAGHTMPVYALRWSPFHPRVFLSASADWSVRLWDDSHPQAAIMVFDVGTALGDVAWAPFSATNFAAATDEGKVLIFDLQADVHAAICEQKVVKKARCSHLLFLRAAGGALLLAGNSAGGVDALKLSPNLRRAAAAAPPPPRKGEAPREPPSRHEAELRKLDRLLAASDAKIDCVTELPVKGSRPAPPQLRRGSKPAADKPGGGGDAAAALPLRA